MMGADRAEINPSRRTFRFRDQAFGLIRTGTEKIRSGFGNGDCIMLDFTHRVFAVADGSERAPWASRDLLTRLWTSLLQYGTPESLGEWIDMLIERVYSGQKYQHKTTFSCVAVRGEGDEKRLFIFHGGDSIVTLMNPAEGSILFQTGRDMNFAGRSKSIADCTEHPLADRNIRVAISTDGFNDLLRYCRRQSLFPLILKLPFDHPVEQVCDEMHRVLDAHGGKFEHDDIGLVVLDPFALGDRGTGTILIGGTRPHEEVRYREDRVSRMRDQWWPEEAWHESEREFALAGIEIMKP